MAKQLALSAAVNWENDGTIRTKMGFKVVVLDPDETCPCRYVAHEFIHAAYDDMPALERLGERSDVITYEFENIAAEQLQTLVSKYNVPQSYQAIQLLQDRLTENKHLLKQERKWCHLFK